MPTKVNTSGFKVFEIICISQSILNSMHFHIAN